MNAQEIIDYIANSEKKTPVKVYVNLTATVDGKILATTPDLISLVDTETFIPVTTDALKYGKRVMVVGLKCFHLWRTEKGLELVGPRYFGIDTDYIPLEQRVKGGEAHV